MADRSKAARAGQGLRIAMLGHKRVPSREGGVEIVVEQLATRMVQYGHEVTLFNRGGHHVCGREYDGDGRGGLDGVRVRTVPALRHRGLAAMTSSFFAALRAALGRYDVVHFHAEGPCFFIWLPKLFGKRCIATIHGLDWKRAKWKGGLGSLYIRMGERMAVRHADEIIVLSRGVQDYFSDRYGRRTVFIPNGVQRPETVPAVEITERFGLHKDEYILFLGRIVPEKGLKYLAEAFLGLCTDKKLVFAGGSSDTSGFMREMMRLTQGDGRVVFTGFIQGRLLGELYSNAYLYCLPSDLEGMPLSLLEAMSYGNCCVVSDIPECAEVVEDNAVTFRRSNVLDLRDKLRTLCSDEAMVREYRSRAADFICRKYCWDDVAKATVETYIFQ